MRKLLLILCVVAVVQVHAAPDRVIIDWSSGKVPSKDLKVEGYAFGSHEPVNEERMKAAKTTPNQIQYQSGVMTTPEFIIEHPVITIDCSGTYHPKLCAVSLIVGKKAVRSYSSESSTSMRNEGSSSAWFDVKELMGKKAVIEVRDDHFNGWISRVRVVATEKEPSGKKIASVEGWTGNIFEMKKIEGDFLLMPVGHREGTPIQELMIEVDGKEKLVVDLPLAFGDMKIAGYTPIYDLTEYQGDKLKVSYHSFTGEESAKFLVQREIPGRKTTDRYPAFHAYCRLGKLNDPNGLCYIDGVYHIFYQYALGANAKTWAHYTSKDLMHWEEKPTGLFHDHLGSMHSGSAAVDVLNTTGWKKGKVPAVIAAFTGSRGMGGNDKIQVQGIAYSRDGGKTFTKYEGNPVIGKQQHLASIRDSNARDPKIFWFSPTKGRDAYAKDGHWIMVLYEGKSHAIYTSPNCRDWERHGEVRGYYECPELFPLAVDPSSPDGSAEASGNKKEVKWVMYGGDAMYHIGSFDGKTYTPETKSKIRMNYGSRYYAAQTFNNTPKGEDGQERRIQVGWQGQQISTPVELKLKNTPVGLRVCILPVDEIEKLHMKSEKFDGLKLKEGAGNPLAEFKGGLFDIDIVADVSKAEKVEFDIRGNKFVYDRAESTLIYGRTQIKLHEGDKLYLRVVTDNWSMDVFAGKHGFRHMPYMTGYKTKKIGVKAVGGLVNFDKLRVSELENIWKK